jgi:hypothetical protein
MDRVEREDGLPSEGALRASSIVLSGVDKRFVFNCLPLTFTTGGEDRKELQRRGLHVNALLLVQRVY